MTLDTKVIGIAGISGSGKTTIADLLGDALVKFTNLRKRDVAVLHLDNFYRPINDVYDIQGIDGKLDGAVNLVNWDDPRLIDYDRLIAAINELKEKGYTDVPIYDKLSGTYKQGEFERVYGSKIIIVESFLLFSADKVRGRYLKGEKEGEKILENPKQKAQELIDIIDQKIYVKSDSNVALDRRLARDAPIGRHPKHTIAMWKNQVMRAAKKYIYPLVNTNFFDQTYDNNLLDASRLDQLIQNNLGREKIDSIYNKREMRINWINRWYLKKKSTEVLPMYELYWKVQELQNKS